MQRCLAVGVVFFGIAHGVCASDVDSVGVNYGPKNCVTLSRSSAGSCVLTTNCEGSDTSKTEFAFNCVGQKVVRHSFGIGGFDDSEEFDSEVKCDRCDIATPADEIKPAKKEETQTAKTAEEPAKATTSDAKPVSLDAQPKPANPEPKSTEKAYPLQAEPKVISSATIVQNELPVKPVSLKVQPNPPAPVKQVQEAVSKTVSLAMPDPLKTFGKAHPADSVAKPAAAASLTEPVADPLAKPVSLTGSFGNAKLPDVRPSVGVLPAGGEMKAKEPEVVNYGPNGCVSVRRNKEGHCVMTTACKEAEIANYEFGLVCVDKVGSPVKHLFGKGSFDAAETFDTLIKCEECLGLENVPDAVALSGEVATMQKDLSNLKNVMTNISINVKMLNDEVFKSGAPAAAPGGSPAPAAPPSKDDEKEADEEKDDDKEVADAEAKEPENKDDTKVLLHESTVSHGHKKHGKKHHLRHKRHHHHHHHGRHHHHRDYDEDDY